MRLVTDIEHAADLSVAYHDGPPRIGFYGRQWVRGVAQPVTPVEWDAMQARADFKEFDFATEPAPANDRSPAVQSTEE